MLRLMRLTLAAILAIGCFCFAPANAAVFTPATDPIGKFDWSVTPSFSQAWYSDEANKDVGNQSSANVELVLESKTWIGGALSFVSGGPCTDSANCTTPGEGKNGTWTFSGTPAQVFGVHFNNKFIAILFAAPVNNFSIFNLPNGVSNIYAYNLSAVPLPGAIWLMVTALIGWFGANRLRRESLAG